MNDTFNKASLSAEYEYSRIYRPDMHACYHFTQGFEKGYNLAKAEAQTDRHALAKLCSQRKDDYERCATELSRERTLVKELEFKLKAREVNNTLRGYDGLADERDALIDQKDRLKAVLNKIALLGSSELAYTSEFTNQVNALVRGILDKIK